MDAFYASEVVPILTSVGHQPSITGFLRAYSLVCSRAFLVDAYHGLSMVPVADAYVLPTILLSALLTHLIDSTMPMITMYSWRYEGHPSLVVLFALAHCSS